MATAVDATSNGGNNTGGSSVTWTHTCTGSNLILIVNSTLDSGSTVTAVSFNGVPATLVNSATSSGRTTYMHYLINPATGSHTVQVDRNSGTGTIDTSAVSYTGMKQSSQPETSVTSTSTTSNLSLNITTSTDNAWLVASTGVNQSSGAITAGTNNFARIGGGIDGQAYGSWDSNAGQGTAGSKSMAWVASNITLGTYIVASFSPVPSNIKTINGLAIASVKTYNGLTVANTKTINGLS